MRQSPIDDCQFNMAIVNWKYGNACVYVSFTRSLILTARFSSMLLRAAMPVRHDNAPARESGTLMCSGAGVWRKI